MQAEDDPAGLSDGTCVATRTETNLGTPQHGIGLNNQQGVFPVRQAAGEEVPILRPVSPNHGEQGSIHSTIGRRVPLQNVHEMSAIHKKRKMPLSRGAPD